MQSVGCKISIRHFLVAIKILHFKIGPNALKKRVYITVGSVSLTLYGGVPENLEYVDIFKMKNYIMDKKFKVDKLDAVNKEIAELSQEQQDLLKSEYNLIETKGIEFVRVKHLQSKIFEIKSKELRSLFKYQEGKIIVIGVVFVKKTQKTPKDKIKLAKQRLKEE